jgi:hypothetical protein
MVMNGGPNHAAEVLTHAEVGRGADACRYFGLAELARVMADLLAAADSDAADLRLSDEYDALVSQDAVLVRAFEERYETAPEDFEPI